MFDVAVDEGLHGYTQADVPTENVKQGIARQDNCGSLRKLFIIAIR